MAFLHPPMSDALGFGRWDWALLGAISVQATVVAYLHSPRWKAFVLSIPVPFTLATLSLGRPLDATNVLGTVLLLLFAFGVYWLHDRRGLPIVPSIVASALAYCCVASILAPLLPATASVFWASLVGAVGVGIAVHLSTKPRREAGHRSQLPVWIKLPIVAGVVLGLVALKKLMLGFMSVFPMVGVITAYEARHSLWTIFRQMPIVMMTLLPMMAVVRLTHEALGLPLALLVGWCALLAILIPLTLRERAAQADVSDRGPSN